MTPSKAIKYLNSLDQVRNIISGLAQDARKTHTTLKQTMERWPSDIIDALANTHLLCLDNLLHEIKDLVQC